MLSAQLMITTHVLFHSDRIGHAAHSPGPCCQTNSPLSLFVWFMCPDHTMSGPVAGNMAESRGILQNIQMASPPLNDMMSGCILLADVV